MKENSTINKNGKIATLTNDEHSVSGSVARNKLIVLKKEVDSINEIKKILMEDYSKKNGYLLKQIANRSSEILSIKKQIVEMEKQIKWAEDSVRRYKSHIKRGLILDVELLEKEKVFFESNQNFLLLEEKLIRAESLELELNREIEKNRKEMSESIYNLNSKKNIYDMEILEQEKKLENTILSPFDGVLVSISVNEGQYVKPGQKIAFLLPNRSVPYIELYTKSDSIGGLIAGQKVKIRAAAWPWQTYGKIDGVVEDISFAPVDTLKGVESSIYDENVFRIRIKPVMHKWAAHLRPGMSVETEIFTRSRRIYEWLFIPTENFM